MADAKLTVPVVVPVQEYGVSVATLVAMASQEEAFKPQTIQSHIVSMFPACVTLADHVRALGKYVAKLSSCELPAEVVSRLADPSTGNLPKSETAVAVRAMAEAILRLAASTDTPDARKMRDRVALLIAAGIAPDKAKTLAASLK